MQTRGSEKKRKIRQTINDTTLLLLFSGRENFRGKWIVTKTAAFHCGKCSNSGIGLIPDRINAYKHVKTKLHGGRSWILMASLWSWIAMLDGVYTPAIWITFMSSIIRVSTSFNRFAGSVSQTGTRRDSHLHSTTSFLARGDGVHDDGCTRLCFNVGLNEIQR